VQYTLGVRYIEDVALAELVREDREIARLREVTRRNPELRADAMRLGERVVVGLERKAAADAGRLVDGLPVVRELRRRPREQPEAVLDVTLLVDREAAGDVEGRIEDLARQHADRMRFRLLGPQAPYEFVGGA
jgi:hypothetical protein